MITAHRSQPRTHAAFVVVTALVGAVPAAHAGFFTDVTAHALGRETDDPATDGWSNKVTVADINGDGLPDILVANGGDYNTAGTPEMSFAWLNHGDGTFTDVSDAVFGQPGLTRVIKAEDVDGDGDVDLFVGGSYQTKSRLLINDGHGNFTDESAARLPQDLCSFGDAEFGDIDGDGDLDIVAADWGDGDPFQVRGRPRVWINDGTGHFVDESDKRLPDTKTGMSWDLTLIDADNDLDLDVLVSCKACSDGGIYLENQGDGTFLDRSEVLPGAGNNYVYEAMDVDGDGDLDLVTVNDGPNLTERLLINKLNEDEGVFVDASDQIDAAANPEGADDNAAVFADVDGDGDVDVIIGSLSDKDRVWINDGTGHFSAATEDAVDAADTPGTLGIAVADFDGDKKLDLVMVQGEQAFGDRIYKGLDTVVDNEKPHVEKPRAKDGFVYARVHDWHSPTRADDFKEVHFAFDSLNANAFHMGEQLFRAEIPEGAKTVSVCATDKAGNNACSDALTLPTSTPPPTPTPTKHGQCVSCGAKGPAGCSSASDASPIAFLGVLVAVSAVNRRRHARVRGAL